MAREAGTGAAKDIPKVLISDNDANILNPATEDKQDDIISRIGDVETTPTQHTLLRRIKDLLTGIILAAGNNIIGLIKLTDGTNTATLNRQGHQEMTLDTQTLVLNRYVAKFHAHTSTLSAPSAIDDTSIFIQGDDYGSFANGDRLALFDPTTFAEENDFPIITDKPGNNELTLNKPLDKAYTIGSSIQHVEINIFDAAGSLGSPVSYKLFPPPGVSFHIRGGVAVMTHDNPGDYSTFGDETELTNGLVARVSASGVRTTLSTFQKNLDFEEDTSIPIQFIPNSGPGGSGGVNGVMIEYKLQDWGTYVTLNGNNNTDPNDPQDYFELLVQDDLTESASTLIEGRFKVHGYVTIN